MNQKTYKITFGQQALMLFHLILTNSVVIGFCIYKFGWAIATYSVIAICLVISIIPTITVHIQYLIKNSGLILIVDVDKKYFEFNEKGKISKYSFLDISRLIRTSSYGRGSGWYSFAEYRYYRIIFKDNSEFIITCLLVNNIEKTLIARLDFKEEKKLKVLALL